MTAARGRGARRLERGEVAAVAIVGGVTGARRLERGEVAAVAIVGVGTGTGARCLERGEVAAVAIAWAVGVAVLTRSARAAAGGRGA